MRIEPEIREIETSRRGREMRTKREKGINERSLKTVTNVHLKDKGRTCSTSNSK